MNQETITNLYLIRILELLRKNEGKYIKRKDISNELGFELGTSTNSYPDLALHLVDEHFAFLDKTEGRKINQNGIDYLQSRDLDEKLKSISLGSLKLNKWLPLYALIIAILTAGVPIGLYMYSGNDIQYIQLEGLQLMQDKQEIHQQKQQRSLDSIISILSVLRHSL